jgi:hypothetical protein
METITPQLLQWAETPMQVDYIQSLLSNGANVSATAREFDKSRGTIRAVVGTVLKKAAVHGYSPDGGLSRVVPAPFVAKGHSTLDRIDPYTGQRTQVLQWTKTRLDDEAWAEQIKLGVEAFISQTEKIPSPKPKPATVDTDVIPWIQIGDAHLGMLAHEAETGANFDLKIAERELCTGISMLVDQSPRVERMVIQDVGDFTHYENMSGVTEASGHALDLDGRFPKMVEVYARVMRFIVDKALEKADFVDVIINQGNHSRTNDIWMATLLRHVYADGGRVSVLNNHSPFIGYRMGNTFVMCHHSDKCKPNRLASVMATDFSKDWGETDYRYIDIGHIHHGMVLKEHPGVHIESWNQLAARDKWAHDGGYRSRQSITMVFRSRTYGEIGRQTLPVRAIRDRIRATTGPQHYIPPAQTAFTV